MRTLLFAIAAALVVGGMLAPVATAAPPEPPQPECYDIYNEYDLLVVTVYQYSSCEYGVGVNDGIILP